MTHHIVRFRVYQFDLLLFLDFQLQVPIYARAQDVMHLLHLKKVGATDAILESAEVKPWQFFSSSLCEF